MRKRNFQMEFDFNYITPNIKKYESLQALLDDKLPYYILDKTFSFESLLSLKRVFFVAEPGYGKTRLLKEIILQAHKRNEQGIFIDLKKVDKNLQQFIAEKLSIIDDLTELSSDKEKFQRATIFKTNNFHLYNTQKTVVCLDALDEVKQQDFSKVVDWIKEFSKQYPNIHLFISCRSHHIKKYSELFTHLDLSYVQINRFSMYQTEKYLKEIGILPLDIEKIQDFLKFSNRELLIQIPRYLEMLTETIKEKGIEHTRTLTKTGLFEDFIYKELETEEKKINIQKKAMIKRVLEKLALVMEIYQTNELTKEELMTFFDDVKSNLNIIFLQQVPIEIFYDRSLLKDNGNTIEFENTEFQEYLAAKEILRLGRTDQVIFDLAVDQELREIFPSWFNTLGFVIDFDISLLKPILFFGTSKNNNNPL